MPLAIPFAYMLVKPFKAIRPKTELASKVSSLPYDVYSEDEARAIVASNPDSFLKIVRPETTFPLGTDHSSEMVYKRAKDLIDEDLQRGILEEDKEESYYIYRQIMNGRTQTGIVACFSVDDYDRGSIKKHELTLASKEDDRTKHIDITSANTGLVFLAFNGGTDIRDLLASYTSAEPLYDFVSIDNVRQIVWKISDHDDVLKIKNAFAQVDSMYIADGHHRSASAAAVCKKRRDGNKEYTGAEEFNYFMAVAFPYEDLLVMPYYRVVRDLNGLTSEEFIGELGKSFIIEKKDLATYEPKCQGEIALYLDDIWYKLTAKPEILRHDAIGSLDVSMLQDNILGPILGINDPRTDERIDFIGGIRGIGELEKRCHEDMRAAFAMHHTTVEQLMRIADEGKIMPPKSTWFEPKLQSGLFIHKI